MGCAASSIDKEEKVRVFKERKRLMKQLVGFRGEFADSQLAYLRALKNTGAALRQFTESETLELENNIYGLAFPPSPPPPLPPSPPPLPPFSPDLKRADGALKEEVPQEESIDIDEDDSSTPPPPPILSSSWDIWDTFEPTSPHCHKRDETEGPIEEENWAETKTEFEEDDQEEEAIENVVDMLLEKPQHVEVVDDNSSTMSWYTKDTTDITMISWKSKKTLEAVVKELDEYFLKASAGVKEIAVLIDINVGNNFPQQDFNENKRKRCNSARVFNALSWSWSFRSLQFNTDAVEFAGPSEPCRPGAHCITLKKLCAAEHKLYKEVKEEEITKLEHERKSSLLQKQEDENHDWTKTEKTRFAVENLESDIIRLQQSISSTCSSILMLIDEELYPQLVALTSGLKHMWSTMYECHQVQNHISQQLNYLTDDHSIDLTDSHRRATAQLETEVTAWHNSFCKLVKSQQEYVRILCRWIQLAESLIDDRQQSVYSFEIRCLCEKWLLALDRLPNKVASEAIKSFSSAICSILMQQMEEHNMQKKYEKLEKRLQKELYTLDEMEKKIEGDGSCNLSPKNPVSLKRSKFEALKKQVESGREKYQNSVEVRRDMTINNLKTGLPNVFQALTGFSSAFIQSIETVCSRDHVSENSTN